MFLFNQSSLEDRRFVMYRSASNIGVPLIDDRRVRHLHRVPIIRSGWSSLTDKPTPTPRSVLAGSQLFQYTILDKSLRCFKQGGVREATRRALLRTDREATPLRSGLATLP